MVLKRWLSSGKSKDLVGEEEEDAVAASSSSKHDGSDELPTLEGLSIEPSSKSETSRDFDDDREELCRQFEKFENARYSSLHDDLKRLRKSVGEIPKYLQDVQDLLNKNAEEMFQLRAQKRILEYQVEKYDEYMRENNVIQVVQERKEADERAREERKLRRRPSEPHPFEYNADADDGGKNEEPPILYSNPEDELEEWKLRQHIWRAKLMIVKHHPLHYLGGPHQLVGPSPSLDNYSPAEMDDDEPYDKYRFLKLAQAECRAALKISRTLDFEPLDGVCAFWFGRAAFSMKDYETAYRCFGSARSYAKPYYEEGELADFWSRIAWGRMKRAERKREKLHLPADAPVDLTDDEGYLVELYERYRPQDVPSDTGSQLSSSAKGGLDPDDHAGGPRRDRHRHRASATLPENLGDILGGVEMISPSFDYQGENDDGNQEEEEEEEEGGTDEKNGDSEEVPVERALSNSPPPTYPLPFPVGLKASLRSAIGSVRGKKDNKDKGDQESDAEEK